MNLIEVNNPQTAQEFLQVNVIINKNLPHYIQPLDVDINEVFDEAKNKNFSFGKCYRWIVKDDKNNLIGRIAAFVHKKYINKGTHFITGGIGFFDSINNQACANLLFNTAKKWLQQNECEAMDGPINFGDRDKYWGLLVEGFDKQPLYAMPFNHSYYKNLFEGYGFKNYYNQYWFTSLLNEPLPHKFVERYQKFATKPDYTASALELNNLPKYAQDFATIYNTAWAQHGEEKSITVDEVLKLFNTMKPIIDHRVAWFAYYKNEPIGMFICIPDINQYIQNFKGKLGLWQKVSLIWQRRTKKNQTLYGLIFGVVPKFQALGIDSFLIQSFSLSNMNKTLYKTIEMGWAGDWNPRMHNIYKSLGGTQSRMMTTYRYIFDESKNPFERHPVMDYK
jgi:hypothetical protein